MRDSLVVSNPCQRPTLHPSLANTRRRSHFHSTRLFEFIGRDEEGRPSPLRLWVLFNATRGGNPSRRVCLSSLDATKRGDPLCCVYGFYSTQRGGKPSPSHLFDFIRRDEEGRPSPSCLFGVLRCDKAPNTKSVPIWAYFWCLCFLVLSSFPIPCHPATPPSLNTRDRGVLFN